MENRDGSFVIKAHGGDRAANLEELAKEFREFPLYDLDEKDRLRFEGYCVQLEIIADEWRSLDQSTVRNRP